MYFNQIVSEVQQKSEKILVSQFPIFSGDSSPKASDSLKCLSGEPGGKDFDHQLIMLTIMTMMTMTMMTMMIMLMPLIKMITIMVMLITIMPRNMIRMIMIMKMKLPVLMQFSFSKWEKQTNKCLEEKLFFLGVCHKRRTPAL